jgi:hypothetical protein
MLVTTSRVALSLTGSARLVDSAGLSMKPPAVSAEDTHLGGPELGCTPVAQRSC